MIRFENPKNCSGSLVVKRRSSILSLVSLVLGGLSGNSTLAASPTELPSSGTVEYATTYTGTVHSTMELAEGKHVELREIIGLSRTVAGSSHYDGLSVRCLVYFEETDKIPRINGNCTQLDSDGDQMYQRFGAGKIEILGGTGKYKGMSGTGVISGVRYFKAQTPQSRLFEINHQIEWKLD